MAQIHHEPPGKTRQPRPHCKAWHGPSSLILGVALGAAACTSGGEGAHDLSGFGGAAGGPPLVSSRTPLGAVSLSAAWPNGSSGTTRYRSSASQYVECVWDRRGSTRVLSVTAGDEGGIEAANVLLTGVNAELLGTRSFLAAFDSDLSVLFRFEGKDGQRFEYFNSTTTQHATTCSLQVDSFEPTLAGHLACRDLVATPRSADYEPLDIPAASVTLAFECPLAVLDSVSPPSTGGQPGTGGGGTGGSGTGGGGGGACRGSATPCTLVSGSECTFALGCRTGGTCSGSAWSCYSMYGSYSCGSQDGCYWSSASSQCSGSARSCSSYTTSTGCTYQDGCRWRENCEGTPWSCTSLSSKFDCDLQPGCYWSSD